MAGTSSSSKMTEAEIDKLTVAKLKALLDEKEIAYEKKELKATLAAKLKESFVMKEENHWVCMYSYELELICFYTGIYFLYVCNI